MNRKRRENAELREVSEHLYYEVTMLFSVASGLASAITGESVIHNALVESFAIHMRNVLSFLYAKNPRLDDVIAEDFFPTPEMWTGARAPKSHDLKKVHKRVGKELAHLTYARTDVTDEMKGWRFMALASEVRDVIDQFVETVSPDLLGPSWSNYRHNRGRDQNR